MEGVIALPAALAAAWLAVWAAPGAVRLISMWVHETGHAVTAWLCGGTNQGNAVINFDPLELAAFSPDNVELRKARQVGPSGRYLRKPAIIVAARQFALTFPFPHSDSYRVRLDDSVTRGTLTIEWFFHSNEGRVDQEEIPFMVVGEVPDTESRSTRRATRTTATRRRARPKKRE